MLFKIAFTVPRPLAHLPDLVQQQCHPFFHFRIVAQIDAGIFLRKPHRIGDTAVAFQIVVQLCAGIQRHRRYDAVTRKRLPYQCARHINVGPRFTVHAGHEIDRKINPRMARHFHRFRYLRWRDVFIVHLQNLFRSRFNAELYLLKPGPLHRHEHLFVDSIDPGLAVPHDVQLLFDKQAAEFEHTLPAEGKIIIANGKIYDTVFGMKVLNFPDDILRAAKRGSASPESGRTAERAAGGAPARRDDYLELFIRVDADASSPELPGKGKRIEILNSALFIGAAGGRQAGGNFLQQKRHRLFTLAAHHIIDRGRPLQQFVREMRGVRPPGDDNCVRQRFFYLFYKF